jgi:16S rRNA (guanine(966)-N(2))-methyltransferase RsmD
MRVITGTAKGRRLEAPAGLETRPTSERTKEAMFSIVQFEIEQASVLDLFAGSGQLGIEALSRGAQQAVFVDSSRDATAVIQSNLLKTRLDDKARVILGDCLSFLRTTADMFDLVFLDPPYGSNLLDPLLEALSGRMQPTGIVLCETEKKTNLPVTLAHLTERKDYFYGKTKVSVYRRGRKEE